jgi:hypothetical protein
LTARYNFQRVSTRRVAVLRILSAIAVAGGFALTGIIGNAQSPNPAQQVQAPLFSQKKTSSNRQSHSASVEVQDIIDASRDVTPELHAHSLLLLVESKQNLDKPLKLKLAREAFDTATTVSAPVKMIPAIFILSTDSNVEMSSYGYALGLDRLSLQSRTVADIAALDPAAARNLLADLSLPEMPPVGCTRALVYRPNSYYDLLKVLARDKKANLKDSKDTTEEMLYPAVSNLQTHTQVGLAMTLLTDSGLSKEQLESLTGTLLGQLSRLRGDERGFVAEISGRRGITGSEHLYQALEQSEPGSGSALLQVFRQYLVDNYKAGGCGELLRVSDRPGQKILPDVIQKFNDEFRDGLGRAKLDPITVQDIDVSVPVVEAEVNNYWSDPEANAYLTAAKKLKFDESGEVRTLSDRESSTWRSQVISFLGKIDDWEADPFQSTEVFNEKLELYDTVINLTTQDDLKWLAIERSLSMLENSSIETENPAQWLWGVMNLQLRASTLVGDRANKALGRDSNFTTRLINSKSRSLHLIGMLESLHLDPFNSKDTGITLP